MTDNEEREALARLIHHETGEAPEESGFVADAILAAFDVALKAHARTDDERKRLAGVISSGFYVLDADAPDDEDYAIADVVLAAGFRRSVVPEPSTAREFVKAALAESDADEEEGGAGWDVEVDARTVLELLDAGPEPQGEPSDAQYPEVDVFAERMRAELVANAHKGDHWQNMTVREAWGEISWHVGKLTGAIKASDAAAIRELAADIANGALMLDQTIAVNLHLDEIGHAAGGVR